MRSPIVAALAAAALLGVGPSGARAVPVPAHPQAPGPVLRGPAVIATGLPIPLRGSRAGARARVTIERRVGRRWRSVGSRRADGRGRFRLRVSARPLTSRYRLRARVRATGAVSRSIRFRARPVTLSAVGDINLGDGVAPVLARRGLRWPWGDVAPVLRRADLAFGNLECAVSRRGHPVPKRYRFRGRPAALRVLHSFAGLDVLNLANNHSLDYGRAAFGDTLRYVRRFGMVPVGAGGSLARAQAPHVVTRLGLRIAFIGFSDILPTSFAATPRRSGTAFATVRAIRRGVRAARRRGDVVVVSFHWGVERVAHEDARQRAFARAAFAAGATVILGGHPHVLEPIRRVGRHRLVAYSLGNFVFSSGSGATSRTGILQLGLSARGVERVRLRRARIVGARPRL